MEGGRASGPFILPPRDPRAPGVQRELGSGWLGASCGEGEAGWGWGGLSFALRLLCECRWYLGCCRPHRGSCRLTSLLDGVPRGMGASSPRRPHLPKSQRVPEPCRWPVCGREWVALPVVAAVACLGLRERSCASTPRDPTSQTPAVGATVPTGCPSPGPDLRRPGVGWTPQPGSGENPAPQPLRPRAPRASSQQRRGGTPGGLPGGVAVAPCPWSAARTRGLRETPDAHPGDAGLGARVSRAPWPCRVEEEGSPRPRGSLCLHLCFLPDSDCLALGSVLSTAPLPGLSGSWRAGVAAGDGG